MRNKKNYVFAAILLFVSLGASLSYVISENEITDVLTLENVEAIAAGETDSEGRLPCYSSFIGKNSGEKTVKDCGDCMDVDCFDCSDKGKCKK